MGRSLGGEPLAPQLFPCRPVSGRLCPVPNANILAPTNCPVLDSGSYPLLLSLTSEAGDRTLLLQLPPTLHCLLWLPYTLPGLCK